MAETMYNNGPNTLLNYTVSQKNMVILCAKNAGLDYLELFENVPRVRFLNTISQSNNQSLTKYWTCDQTLVGKQFSLPDEST